MIEQDSPCCDEPTSNGDALDIIAGRPAHAEGCVGWSGYSQVKLGRGAHARVGVCICNQDGTSGVNVPVHGPNTA
jgi:hypothetical protein